jgi:hypothetical protein
VIDQSATRSAVDRLLDLPPYGLGPEAKSAALSCAVGEELVHHYEHCEPYRKWCRKQGFDPHGRIEDLAGVPFLPVGIFKRLMLRSTSEDQIVRVLTSSATSSQTPSRIPLDRVTRTRQMRALLAILIESIGGQRRPFVVLDAAPSSTAAADRELSARAAGMRGYLMAATSTEYVFRNDTAGLTLDVDRLLGAIEDLKSHGGPFCLLGYTYVLYRHVIVPLRDKGIRLNLPDNALILHFGGWKRLRDQAVEKAVFLAHAADVFGIGRQAVRDIYGFTEQLGVIYPDGADGLKRVPTYSDVLVRDPGTLEVLPDGRVGLLEFVCPLPHSYPGVAVLLDDLGRVVTREQGCGGATATGFEVVGRAPDAETRGCGDTLPRQVYETAPSLGQEL